MEYAQISASGEAIQITTHGNVEWDAENFCSAAALVRDGKAEQFRIVPLTVTEPPAVNALTHTAMRDGCELVDGEWRYKWRIDPLSEQQVAANYAAAREAAWSRIKAERDRRKFAGVQVGRHWFHSDDSSRIQQLALVMMGASIPAGLQWKTLTLSPPPVFVTMTPGLASVIFQATAASDAAIFAAAEAHRVAMESSDDPQGYDCSSDWPDTIEDDQ